MAPVSKRRRAKTCISVLGERTANSLQQSTEDLTFGCRSDLKSTSVSSFQDVQSSSSLKASSFSSLNSLAELQDNIDGTCKRAPNGERPFRKRNWKMEVRTGDLGKKRHEGEEAESSKNTSNLFDEISVPSEKNDADFVCPSGDTGYDSPVEITKTKYPSRKGDVSGFESDEGAPKERCRKTPNFNVPPSPGHVKPCPDKLSLIHRMIQHGETIATTDSIT